MVPIRYYILVPKFNKRDVINNLLIIPKDKRRPFWAREMKLLNSLINQFPKESFWKTLTFNKKYDSLAYFVSEYGKKILKKRYNEYNYKIPKPPKIKLGDKVGEDKKIIKNKTTIKDFFK